MISTVFYVTLYDTHLSRQWSQPTALTGQSRVVLTYSLTCEIEIVLQMETSATTCGNVCKVLLGK